MYMVTDHEFPFTHASIPAPRTMPAIYKALGKYFLIMRAAVYKSHISRDLHRIKMNKKKNLTLMQVSLRQVP
jgi:hypothetical protein